MSKKVFVVGSGNAALCAGIAALEAGADVLMLEKADAALAGGNTNTPQAQCALPMIVSMTSCHF